jgi:hypothetical protein
MNTTNYTNIFYTIPINASIMQRDNDNNKVDENLKPIKLPPWNKYAITQNTINSPLLGAIALNHFIGIDIDDPQIYSQILLLINTLPEHQKPKYIAHSIPKDIKGGHLLFSYNAEQAQALKQHNSLFKDMLIDLQIDKKVIYLATPANHTKELVTPPLQTIQDLTPIPPLILTYLLGLITQQAVLKAKNSTTNNLIVASSKHTDYYGYILSKGLDLTIIPILTPKNNYKDVKHPNDVQLGQGTDWLLQIRRKLQMDISVSPELFHATLSYINSLWDTPMPEERIKSDCEYDINHRDWAYDPEWNKQGLILHTRPQNYTLEVLYEPNSDLYIIFNRTTQHSSYYSTYASARDAIRSQTQKNITKEVLLTKAVPVHTIDTPLEEPFLQSYSVNKQELSPLGLHVFNLFKPTEGLAILRDTELLQDYKKPTLILDFLKNLFPDAPTRTRLLQYLAHKYSTYGYSPLYFVMAGVGGAGKGVFVNILLKYLSGEDRIKSIGLEQLTSRFKSYQLATDWLEIEEAGEGYTKRENEKLVGELKKLTGNKYIQVERKGVDKQEKHRQFSTPIISTNLNTKLITDTVSNDRRLVLLKCPNKLANIIPYEHSNQTLSSTTAFIQAMEQELPHFAKYLGLLQQQNPIEHNNYTDNAIWKTDDYYDYITDSLDEYSKLLNGAEERNIRAVKDALIDASVPFATIDELFAHSTPQTTKMLVYRSPFSIEHKLLTLEDVVDTTPKLDGLVRRDFKRLKSYINIRVGTTQGKCHVVEFNGLYTKLVKDYIPNIAPIEV